MTYRLLTLGAALLAVMLIGCGATQRGSFAPSGYQDATFDLKIASASASGMPMGDQWQLDSHYQEAGKWVPKTGRDWEVEFGFDHDDNGKVDKHQKSAAYDMKFVHAVHGGSIFVRTLPFSRKYEQRDLQVLMRSYVDGASRVGYGLVELASGAFAAEVDRYAVNTVVEGGGRVAGNDAWFSLIEIASVDDLQLSKDSRRERALLVLVRTPFKWVVGGGIVSRKKVEYEYPVLVIAAYSSAPSDFARGIGDFEGLLERIRIAGNAGVSIPDEVRSVFTGAAAGNEKANSNFPVGREPAGEPKAPKSDEQTAAPASEAGPTTPGSEPGPRE